MHPNLICIFQRNIINKPFEQRRLFWEKDVCSECHFYLHFLPNADFIKACDYAS